MRTANHRPAFAGNDNGAPKGMKMRTGRSSFDRVQIKPSLLFRQWRALTGPCQQGVQCRAKRLPPVREAVFHLGWHLIMDDPAQDRQSVVEGKSVSVRVDLGGRRIIKTKKT